MGVNPPLVKGWRKGNVQLGVRNEELQPKLITNSSAFLRYSVIQPLPQILNSSLLIPNCL
jgi:hypothetical protein